MKLDVEANPRLVGAASSGVHKRIAEQAGRRIEKWLNAHGKPVKVQTLRFLPSSKTGVDSGFQLVANTTLFRTDADHHVGPVSGVVESVVTVGQGQKGRRILRGISIPLLETR